jgi:N-acetylmuramoyl-L-alanine amidase
LLRQLAEEVATILSVTLGHEAVILDGTIPFQLAGHANSFDAKCLVGLRVDRAPSTDGAVQVWTASARLDWKKAGGEISEGGGDSRPPLWSETPQLMAGSNERLARTVAAHLESQFGKGRVLRGRRPSRWLEGLLMPAVVLYPANASEDQTMRRLTRTGERGSLARSIAFGIAEAVAEDRGRSRAG